MPRKKRNKLLELQDRLKNNGIDYQEITDRRNPELQEVLIIKNRDFKQKNVLAKEKDVKKTKETVGNKTYKSLWAGFINSNNKDLYIKSNREHILSLDLNKQRNFISRIIPFL